MLETLDLKYRPRTYEELVGQDTAITSLQGDLVRSYIFTGFSGVGKTTAGRIFARQHESEVLELDTASLGKADIETLKENAYYKPMFNKHKFVILDEVHNLSKQAWDSLLKVIEEGPKFLTWILITTEMEKVPRTIQTRSRIVSFKKIKIEDMVKHLKTITEKEEREVDENILHNISAYSNGSVREAVKALETYYTTGDISVKDYQKEAVQLLEAVYTKDYETIILLTEEYTATDLELLVRVITEYITFTLLLTVSKERPSPRNNVGAQIMGERTTLNPELIDDFREMQAGILANFEMIGNQHIRITVDSLYRLMNVLMQNYNKFQDVSMITRGALLWFSETL